MNMDRFSYNRKYLVVFYNFLLSVVIVFTTGNIAGTTREYCLYDDFNPTCHDDEVVVMEEALYGRIKLGKCVKIDYGHLGCYSDELEALDGICSGRTSCEMEIYNSEMITRLGCLNELNPYLEAKYSCQKVYIPRRSRCNSLERIPIQNQPGVLASSVTYRTSCGSNDSPWLLEASPGQRINISLTDFGWQNSSTPGRVCTKYGYIIDMNSNDVINICGGGQREKWLYLTSGHSVQVVLEMSGDSQFLIQYEALGCPDYETPPNSWLKRQNNTIVIGCVTSEDSWTLKCVDNIWLGVVGACPTPSSTTKELVTEPISTTSETGSLPPISRNHVIAFGLGCLTLIVCCAVVIVGCYCTKRYEVNAKFKQEQVDPLKVHFVPSAGTVLGPRSTMAYRPVIQAPGTPGELPPYTLTMTPDDTTPPKVPTRASSYRGSMPHILEDSDSMDEQTDSHSVQYYILENPAESEGNVSDQMYQSLRRENNGFGQTNT